MWVGRTATDIAAAVRAGEVTARAVVAEHLDRIARLNPELGAFVRVRETAALAEAEGVTGGPLAGVPVAIKDNIPVAGEPLRHGSAATSAEPEPADHPLVARLRAAGAIIVGQTNLPELGIYPFTDSAYGTARNPWDLSRTPGGSSGGAAAAVASAMVPIAHGNDGAGSIRIPAADCRLFGIKPGPGVVPAGIGSDDWSGMAENGPLATTVADATLMLSVMAGTDITPERPSRIAFSTKPPGPGITVNPIFTTAVREAATLLTRPSGAADSAREAGGLGGQAVSSVEEADPPYPLWSGLATIARWFSCVVPDAEPYFDSLEPRTRTHVRVGRLVRRFHPPTPGERDRLRAELAPFFDRYDVLMLPSLAQLPPQARRWGERSWLASVGLSLRYAPMCGVWNLAGFPAAVVPFGRSSVQLVAAPGGESQLLAVATRLEAAAPWNRHAPAYR